MTEAKRLFWGLLQKKIEQPRDTPRGFKDRNPGPAAASRCGHPRTAPHSGGRPGVFLIAQKREKSDSAPGDRHAGANSRRHTTSPKKR
ncbi:MAG: hypothetical protein JW929_06095 [Anaerolineales bacterium]|nr:hypothetical protein [Anaerolineales bacterium]